MYEVVVLCLKCFVEAVKALGTDSGEHRSRSGDSSRRWCFDCSPRQRPGTIDHQSRASGSCPPKMTNITEAMRSQLLGRTRWFTKTRRGELDGVHGSNLTMMALRWFEVSVGNILDTNDILLARGGRNNGRWDACSCFCRHLAQYCAHSFLLCCVSCRWCVRRQLLLYVFIGQRGVY